MPSETCVIRPAEPRDCAALLDLMRKLAKFEGYSAQFRVTEDALRAGLFERQDFAVLVAEADGRLTGMLVYYFLPFTYDLTRWIYLKELFVEPEFRRAGTGEQLLKALARACRQQGGRRIRFDVLAGNTPAEHFYRALGARPENEWRLFSFREEAIAGLADTEKSATRSYQATP